MKYYVKMVAYKVVEFGGNWGDRDIQQTAYNPEGSEMAKQALQLSKDYLASNDDWLKIKQLEYFIPADEAQEQMHFDYPMNEETIETN